MTIMRGFDMIENWELSKVYYKRSMFVCPNHISQKGSPDLDVTLEGGWAGFFHCWSCGYSGKIPDKDLEKLRSMRTETPGQLATLDWDKLNQDYISNRFSSGVQSPLAFSKVTMMKLEHGWDGTASTFPERDGLGNVIGILRRFPDNNKGTVSGSRRGLTIPRITFDPSQVLYITEGCSDLGVILECGLHGIARPNSNGCNDMVGECLSNKEFKSILIVADYDGPGVEGANELSALLGEVKVAAPMPYNDLYDMYLAEGKDETQKWLSE